VIAHLRYARYVLRHKWFVLLAGRRIGAPLWRLLVHDWSKFLPSEWLPYARHFYGNYPPLVKEDIARAFDAAWLHHQKRNRHHWQYWLLIPDQKPKHARRWIEEAMGDGYDSWIAEYDRGEWQGRIETNANDIVDRAAIERLWRLLGDANSAAIPLPMPEQCVREMVADWMGAGRALGKPDTQGWYRKNQKNMQLHPHTRQRVEELLEVVS
jgi:hypothetical protein